MQGVFAGMAKWRMPQIMRQRHGFGQFGLQTQSTGNRACHLCHFDGMCQAGSVTVTFMLNEHLRLVLEPSKRAGVNDPVPVALKA